MTGVFEFIVNIWPRSRANYYFFVLLLLPDALLASTLSASAPTNGQVTISWTCTGIYCELTRRIDGGSSVSLVETNLDSSSYVDNFNPNRVYYYTLKTYDAGGISGPVVREMDSTTVENAAPEISAIGNQVISGDTQSPAIGFTVSDRESVASSLSVTALSSNTSLIPNSNILLGGSGENRTVRITPASNTNGSSTITIRVSDGYKTTSENFRVDVEDIPVASTISFNMLEDTSQTRTVTVTGAEGLSTTLHIVSQPDNGVVSISGKNITFTPNNNWFGNTNFTYRPKDSEGKYGSVRTAQVAVTPVNDKPIVALISYNLLEDSVQSKVVNVTDVDGDAVTLHIESQSEHGIAAVDGNTITFEPDPAWYGVTSFAYKARDENRAYSLPKVADVTVVAVDDGSIGGERQVIFLHTDMLGSPASETKEDGTLNN